MPEPRLQPLPSGKIKIGAEHFRRVVRRIECTKPLAGEGITLRQEEDGIVVSAEQSARGPGPLAKVIALTVCVDGEPGTIYVLGYDNASDLEADGFAPPLT